MVGQRAALRLLFVVLVAAGIAGMHTLGHPTSSGHGAHNSGTPAVHQSPVSHLADDLTTGAMAAGHAVLRGPEIGLDPSAVCLAILTAFALAALLAALLFGNRRVARPDRLSRGVLVPAGRGPPRSPPVGLRLADLSVLRT